MYIKAEEEIGNMLGKCRECGESILQHNLVWKARNQLYCNYECFQHRMNELQNEG